MKNIPSAALLFATLLLVPFAPSYAATPAAQEGQAPRENAAAILQTRHARIRIDTKGCVTSIVAVASGKEYSPAGHPSALLGLHENGQPNDKLLTPVSAVYDAGKEELALKYPNGSVAVVKAQAKDGYFRFQLASLTQRDNLDGVVWGPLNTVISGKMGDLIGVVRDNDWAIGMIGLDDNTITGPMIEADCYSMGYYIHSPDPVKYPVPPKYKEGQKFSVGGNGIDDTAFFCHPEMYFQYIMGSGTTLHPEFGSSVAYHARDRRKPHTHFYALLPGIKDFHPRHMVSDPVEGVDFIGSGIGLYACPDDDGLKTIEKITLDNGLPYITQDGKWIRDPTSFTPTVWWGGPRDKCIEYVKALGLKNIMRETPSWYASGKKWGIGGVDFSGGKTMPFREFTKEANKHGLTSGGLHTLGLFLQSGVSKDVSPIPSEHLQTVCRTKLAKDISATDTEIVVTDPSFLGEADSGYWTSGEKSNILRIGGELLRHEGISHAPPWTLKGVKRGGGGKAAAHKAGDELVKLQRNCYQGFLPDMKLMLEYADNYAEGMVYNGMDSINFDGFEGTLQQGHGYYAARVFCRRLSETYHTLSGGKWPLLRGSCVFAGSWEYFYSCDLGEGDRGFDAVTGRFGIQGKDISQAFGNSYYPATFGSQNFSSSWSLADVENLQAKAIGWDATYAFFMSQAQIDRAGEKDAIFKAFPIWQEAREAGVFSKAMKARLTDPDFKYHLEKTGEKAFVLYPVKETKITATPPPAAEGKVALVNPYDAQPLHFAMQLSGPINGCTITLPDGAQIVADQKIEGSQYIMCKGKEAYVADIHRKKIADLKLTGPATLPKGDVKIGVTYADRSSPRFTMRVWATGKGEEVQ